MKNLDTDKHNYRMGIVASHLSKHYKEITKQILALSGIIISVLLCRVLAYILAKRYNKSQLREEIDEIKEKLRCIRRKLDEFQVIEASE